MFISFEGKIEKEIYIVMQDYPDDSFSILGICDSRKEAEEKCHTLSKINVHERYSYTSIDLIGIVEDLLSGLYL